MNKYGRKYLAKFDRGVEDSLKVLGAQMVTWADYLCPKISKNLANSLTYSTSTFSSDVKQPTEGESLEKPGKGVVRYGSSVVYAPRVEYGFSGQDSLGRSFNQPGTPFLRGALLSHKKQIGKLFARLMRGAMK